MPRLVLDAGVLVSVAILPRGVCGQLLYQAASARWQIVACPTLMAEVRDVLQRPKFRRYLSESQADEFVVCLSGVVNYEPDLLDVLPATPDPDDYLIALALESGADWLVSGDAHLDDVTDVDVVIVSPSRMLEIVLEGRAE